MRLLGFFDDFAVFGLFLVETIEFRFRIARRLSLFTILWTIFFFEIDLLLSPVDVTVSQTSCPDGWMAYSGSCYLFKFGKSMDFVDSEVKTIGSLDIVHRYHSST